MKKLALALVSLAVSFGLAEGVYRWSQQPDAPKEGDDDWYARYRNMNETLYRRSDDPELVYEPVPGASVEMEYGTAAFNAAGMRDDREPADGETTRVAVIGDSIVWTEFLPVEDSLPRQLSIALGEEYDVLNFGVSGYDTSQEAAWYERAARPYEPDVVVVVYCMNDMMIMSGPFERFCDDEQRARKTEQEAFVQRVAAVRRETIDGMIGRDEEQATFKLLARLSGMWKRWRFDSSYVDEYLVMLQEPERVARVTDAITRMGAAIRHDGARAIFVISPVLESWDDYHWGEIHEVVGEAARGAGFEVLDPLERWPDEQSAQEMRIDNLHYDQSGNEVFAHAIAEAIR